MTPGLPRQHAAAQAIVRHTSNAGDLAASGASESEIIALARRVRCDYGPMGKTVYFFASRDKVAAYLAAHAIRPVKLAGVGAFAAAGLAALDVYRLLRIERVQKAIAREKDRQNR